MKKRLIAVFCLTVFTYIAFASSLTSSAASTGAPAITAETAIVADADTGSIYYQKNMHEKMYPASITKILTGLLAVEKGNDSDVLTISDNIREGMPGNSASIALTGGEQITQEEALYTMFLASANDSANALALHVGGSIGNFVNMMNSRAKELGCTDTHFANANGLPDKNNLTTAYDMALITKKALETPKLMKYFGATSYVMPATNKRNKQAYLTLHKMMKNTVYKYGGVIAGKTGWETMSGHTLVTVARRNGHTFICVLMKSSSGYTVYSDTISLLNYCFSLAAPGTLGYLKTQNTAPAATVSAVNASSSPAPVNVEKAAPARDDSYAVPLLLIAVSICTGVFLITSSRKSKNGSTRA